MIVEFIFIYSVNSRYWIFLRGIVGYSGCADLGQHVGNQGDESEELPLQSGYGQCQKLNIHFSVRCVRLQCKHQV